MNHIYIGIQKKSKEAIEKKCCELDPDGLENYLLIKYRADDGVGTMKVNERFLKMAGVTEEEAWDKAMQNICKDTVIESHMIQMQNQLFRYTSSAVRRISRAQVLF